MNLLRTIAELSAREQHLIATRHPLRYDPCAMPEPAKLTAIRAALEAFSRAKAPHALIGGVAVGLHSGVPRATLDVDFAILSTADLDLITEEFTRSGFTFLGRHPHSLNFRHSSGEPVQLARDPEFDPMIERAEQAVFEGLALSVVQRTDLIAMKRRAAADSARRRSKALLDLADIALLEGDVPDPDQGW